MVVIFLIFGILNFKFLSENSTGLTVIFTAFVAVVTLAYALLTRELVKETERYASLTADLVNETRQMRELQTTPNIIISLKTYVERIETTWISAIYLTIQNVGLGVAYDIKFEIDVSSQYVKRDPYIQKFLTHSSLIKNGLPILPPNENTQVHLTVLSGDKLKELIEHKSEETDYFKIKVTYKNIAHRSFETTFDLDFSYLLEVRPETSVLYTIPLELKGIREAIENVGKRGQ